MCLLASLVFVLLFPGRVSSAFFFAALAVPVASLLTALILQAGFRYEQRLDRVSAMKGDTVTYSLVIRNKSLLLLSFLDVSFHSAGSVYAQELCGRALAAPPLAVSTHEIQLPCKYRGSYEIGVKDIRLGDYLGLFSFRQQVKTLAMLTVYPRIVPITAFPVLAGADGEPGMHGIRGSENTENISDIRKYASGDRLRSIHWKLSAKREELMVKNYEQASGADADLILDTSGCGGGSIEERIIAEDRLVECAVSLVWHFVTRSIPVTVWHCGKQPERHSVKSDTDFRALYQILSEAGFEDGLCLPDAVALTRTAGRKTVVAVSAAPGEEMCGLLLKLKSSGCMPVLVHVMPEESSAQPGGALRITLLQSGVAVLAYRPGNGLDTEPAHVAI